jgi:hypothetical protein
MLRLGLLLGVIFSALFALALWFFSKPTSGWEKQTPGDDRFNERP